MHLPPEAAAYMEKMKQGKAYAFFKEKSALPPVLRNNGEVGHRWTQRFDRVANKLGLCSVYTEGSTIEGKRYYRTTIKSPFRKLHVITNPFTTLVLAQILHFTEGQGLLERGVDLALSQEDGGTVVVPAWAVRPMLTEWVPVLKEHAVTTDFEMGEYRRLAAGDEKEMAAEELPVPAAVTPGPTLH